jgi:hypothetical protein
VVAGTAFYLFARSWWDRGIFHSLQNGDADGMEQVAVATPKSQQLLQ